MASPVIPDAAEIERLWNTYNLPEYKRNHCRLVARLSVWMARRLMAADPAITVDTRLLHAAAMLHDIDKAAQKREGEHHPDTGVRLLNEHGYGAVSDLVRTHPLHSILDRTTAPRTWEEKLLYLSDKMVKHDILTVDGRFALWRAEELPAEAVGTLTRTYPLVKELERDVFSRIGESPEHAARLANGT